ncbi:MAG: sugar MFS transporter [Phycisphaerae bacterium]
MKKLTNMFRTADGANYGLTFMLVTSLFLLWGLFSGMIDVLNKHFQDSLHVTKAQSALVQGSWYGAYFLLALPAGWVARKLGYRGGILAGLILALVGSLLFIPAVRIHASEVIMFAAFLSALFVVGAGMTFLETVANPYTTVLGPVESAVSRINLAQSCNAIGWMLGPIVISYFIMSKTAVADTSNSAIYLPYLILAGLVAILIVAFLITPVPDLHAPQEEHAPTRKTQHPRPLMKEKHFVLAVAAQFFYVAGQTGIFSFFINYVKDDRYSPALPLWLASRLPATMKFSHANQWHITEYGAGIMLSVAFGCFLAGRISGSAILRFSKAHITLGIYGLINVVMMLLVYLNLGWTSIIALMLSYFFMSIMYPTIFALGIRGLGEKTKLAASWIVMSIVGGAIMPMFMGWLADQYSMRVGFLMPLGCFVVIMFYGFFWQRFFRQDMDPEEISNSTAYPS